MVAFQQFIFGTLVKHADPQLNMFLCRKKITHCLENLNVTWLHSQRVLLLVHIKDEAWPQWHQLIYPPSLELENKVNECKDFNTHSSFNRKKK
jgi:hypothetical protein